MSRNYPELGNGPQRVLLLDRSDLEDPKWVLATVTIPSDVHPAAIDPVTGRYTAWQATVAWVTHQLCHPVELQPLHDVLVWRAGERR